MKKNFLAFLLTAFMIFSALPTSVFAGSGEASQYSGDDPGYFRAHRQASPGSYKQSPYNRYALPEIVHDPSSAAPLSTRASTYPNLMVRLTGRR